MVREHITFIVLFYPPCFFTLLNTFNLFTVIKTNDCMIPSLIDQPVGTQ